MALKSGNEHDGWEAEYYQSSLRCITDFAFTQKTFTNQPGLVSRPDGSGWKSTEPYTGEPFDHTKYDLVEEAWDHDHCYVCGWRIEESYGYWQDVVGTILCDVCHEYVFTMPKT